MNELKLIVSLFPIIFLLLHEFEEIIGFKHLEFTKDGHGLKKIFKVAKQISLRELHQFSICISSVGRIYN